MRAVHDFVIEHIQLSLCVALLLFPFCRYTVPWLWRRGWYLFAYKIAETGNDSWMFREVIANTRLTKPHTTYDSITVKEAIWLIFCQAETLKRLEAKIQKLEEKL